MPPESGLTAERIAARQRAFYKRGKELALAAGLPDWLESYDDALSIPGDRGKAIALYASEYGIRFIDVRCRRVYMRIDLNAIADQASDMARDPDYEDEAVPYTWEDEGWMWETCTKGDDRAVAFWRCEEKPRPASLDPRGER